MDEIVTKRLTLGRPRAVDVAPFHALVAGDFEVVKQVACWPFPPDPAFTHSRLTDFGTAEGAGGIVLAQGRVVGSMGLFDGELGYMFARAAWGRGYATEAARALVDYCLGRWDWPGVSAGVWADNPASARVLRKLGFGETGRSVRPCRARGRQVAARDFALTRAAWEGRDG